MGLNYNYPGDWNELSRKCKERDGLKCRECGSTKMELHAHHILSKGWGGRDSLDNLITLCECCHSRKHPYMYVSPTRRKAWRK
ncbi:MAG: HNH endonuclease [Nanoarchaeota archaeon]|nr:HNH endonuclease [Nanoarchaeota archaeon]